MIDRVEKSICSGCFACAAVCPVDCIEKLSDSEGFVYPKINWDKCIRCNRCEAVCPVLKPYSPERETNAFAAYANDTAALMNSSSGGVFPLLAQEIIASGGVVFGAVYSETFGVVHSPAQTKEQLLAMLGSKYTQSDTDNTFFEAKKHLDAGVMVYYSGTPCQISGLLGFLGREYENLICQDIICHGVPSPKVWKKYLEELEREQKSSLARISQRDKLPGGWQVYGTLAEFESGSRYRATHPKDTFMRLFLSDICLRPSCHNCRCKGMARESDITLGDFWGVDGLMPRMHNRSGTSLVLLHTQKGRELFGKIAGEISSAPVENPAAALAANPAALFPVPAHSKRSEFFLSLDGSDISELAKKYCAVPFHKRAASFARRMASKTLSVLGLKPIIKKLLIGKS